VLRGTGPPKRLIQDCDEVYYCGHVKVYWFDPETAQWFDDPQDLPDKNWYPSVIQYLENLSPGKFSPIVLGGSSLQSQGCGLSSEGYPFQYDKWWTLDSSYTGTWSTYYDASYSWHWYPRPFLLEGGPQGGAGSVITTGHDINCEAPFPVNPPGAFTPHEYGGNPVQDVTPPYVGNASMHSAGLDPNPVRAVGGWGSSNAVISHTLQDGEVAWDPANWRDHYDLNRIILAGGIEETADANGTSIPALEYALEYKLDYQTPTPTESWIVKASAPPHQNLPPAFQNQGLTRRGRVFGSFVTLPDGTILSCGGQHNSRTSPAPLYYNEADVFDPQGPSDLGSWKVLASRTIMYSDPITIGAVATPRGYHSVALLLKDGTVVLMGGQPQNTPPLVAINTEDTVEIFQPPYYFRTQRLQITAFQGTMEYAEDYGTPTYTPYYLTVNDPGRVSYACLVGVGSVTHHFDYGQRYVELMTRPVNAGGGNIEVLPPPSETMAPAGYYLLFVVELRVEGGGLVPIPSKQGEFVKLTF